MNCKMKKWLITATFVSFWITLLTMLAGCASNTQVVKETQQPAVESSAIKRITQISTTEDAQSSVVRIEGNQMLTYTAVKQQFPMGIFLYFPETKLDIIDTEYQPESDIVASIKASELSTKGQISRLEISLKKDVSYEVSREDTGLKILFKKAHAVTLPAEPKPAKEAKSNIKPELTEQPSASDQTSTHVISQPRTQDNKPAWINRIDYSSETAGKSTIIIGTTTPVKYNVKKINDKKLLLDLYHSILPDYRQRPLITTRFQSAVDRIIPFQTPAMKDTSGFIIELRESVPYFVEQTDSLILLHFEASSIPPKPLDKAELPPWKKVMAQATVTTKTTAMKSVKHRTINAQTKKYAGERIALNFFETDIKNVFRILMDVSGKNFAIDKDVSGTVTLSFDKPVPWDQVLDVILKMNQLGMAFEGDIIRIATLKTLTVEEAERQARITATQKLEEQKKALEPLITEYIPVNYANAKTDVLPHIVLTEGRGSITVDDRNNQIIITDIAEKVKQAKEIVNQIDKVTPQVIIEARIVEASDNFSREFGTSWSVAGTKTDSSSLGGTLGYDMSATNPPTSTLGEIGIQFSRLIGDQFRVIDARLMASESEGTIKIISAPKILTLDNKPAKIKQGLSYPFNKLDADGNTTTEFKDIALELEVTPHVTPDQRISMKIVIKNNEIGAIINNQISFTTKEADTELLVDDGDTVIIGGIRKTKKSTGESGVPLLKNMPVLGWLFKTKSKTDEMEELLIFITPRIVQLEQLGPQG